MYKSKHDKNAFFKEIFLDGSGLLGLLILSIFISNIWLSSFDAAFRNAIANPPSNSCILILFIAIIPAEINAIIGKTRVNGLVKVI